MIETGETKVRDRRKKMGGKGERKERGRKEGDRREKGGNERERRERGGNSRDSDPPVEPTPNVHTKTSISPR